MSFVNATRFIAMNNMTFNLGKVKDLIPDEFQAIPSTEWGSCVKHVQHIGNKYRALDIAPDDEPQPFVVIVSNGSKTDADETDSETDTTSEGKVLDSCRMCCIEQLK